MKGRAIVVALLTAASFIICGSPVKAAPALFVVQSSAGKLYLFGTVHILRSGTQWDSPQLDAAMNESQDLYLEVADPTNRSAALAAFVKVGFDRDHPLSQKISKADVALLNQVASRYGWGSEASFELMRPWMAFLVLSTLPATNSGYTASNGVDLQIRKDFVAVGKPVHGLETMDMQAHIFADMPEAQQISLLESQLKDINKTTSVDNMDAIVNAWISGDEDALATAMQFSALEKSVIYKRIFSDRNNAWATALAARLQQPGTSFVAVGAGHLVGPEGVPALLGRMGFSVTRVNIAEATTPAPSPASAASPAPAATGLTFPTPAASPAGAQLSFPTPAASPTAGASPTGTQLPFPSAGPSPTPIPQIITPPPGWVGRKVILVVGPFAVDSVWIDPKHRGTIILSGHLNIADVTPSLDTYRPLFEQGLVAAAGLKGVQPSIKIRVCNGKQDAIYWRVTLPAVKEDVVLAVSDRAYVLEYVRRKGVADDPAAVRSLKSVCAP